MSRYRGRHRRPSTAAQTAVRYGTAVVLTPVGVSLVGASPAADAAESPNWDAIVSCESEGKNIHTQIDPHVNTASGYFQITDETWRDYGGKEFARTAMGASRGEQQTVANRIFADRGLSPWVSSRDCWKGKTSSAPVPSKSAEKAPKHSIDSGGSYTVRPGDTLVKIANEHHTTWKKLVDKNRHSISDPTLIRVGQLLAL